jgi:hypothetical protein
MDYEKVANTGFGANLRWLLGGGRLGAGWRRDISTPDWNDGKRTTRQAVSTAHQR